MTSCTVALFVLACIEAVSFPVQAEIEHASKTAGEGRSTPGVNKKIGGEVGRGEREGAGDGEERNRLQSIPNILPNFDQKIPFIVYSILEIAHKRVTNMQFH